MRLRHFYGEWGQILAGQTNSLFMDIDVFPNTIDYWGPSGMVFYRNVQIRWTPYKTDNSHFAIAIERPGNDIDSGNLRLIEGLEGRARSGTTRNCPDLTAQYRFGGDWGHLQLGGILRKVGYEVRAFQADSWTEGSETGWGINVGSVFNVLEKDAIRLQVVYGEGIASYMNDGGMDLAPAVELRRGRGVRPPGRGGSAHWRARVLRPLLERQVVELDRLQLHGSGQHQLPGPGRVQEDRLRLGQPAVLPRRQPDGGRAS